MSDIAAVQPVSSVNPEEELAALKLKLEHQKFLSEHTRSGWQAIKANFRWAVFCALVFGFLSVRIVNHVNAKDLELALVLLEIFVFGYVVYHLEFIKTKLSYFYYADDDARMSSSIYINGFPGSPSRKDIIENLVSKDRGAAENLSKISVYSASVSVFSAFALLELLSPLIWGVEKIGFTYGGYLKISKFTFVFLILIFAAYISFRSANALKKLTETLRVSK